MISRKIKLFPAIAAGWLLLTACGAPTPAPATDTPTATSVPTEQALSPTPAPTIDPKQPVPGGELVIAVFPGPVTLNPLLASSPVEKELIKLSVEGLVALDRGNNTIPVLAEKLPSLSADGLTLSYQLKKVTFSNGDPLTCQDVLFTHQAILSSSVQLGRSGHQAIASITCDDEHTASVTFSRPYTPYLELFETIIPRAAGNLAEMEDWGFNRAPIGTGPWMVQTWRGGQELVYVRNPHYREKGKPYLDRLVVRMLSDRDSGLELLAAGRIDSLWGLTEADLPALFDTRTRYTADATGESSGIIFNLGNPQVDAANPGAAPHPILSDAKVRQAIQLGIDKQLLADFLSYGRLAVATTLLPLGPFACPSQGSQYDPETAGQLLDEAGWKTGADGVRAKAGQRLKLKLHVSAGNALHQGIADMLVEMMRSLGLELTLEQLPEETLLGGWESNDLAHHGRFDMLMVTHAPFDKAQGGSLADPGQYLLDHYHSSRIPSAGNQGVGNNLARYVNAEVDNWLDEAAAALDAGQRQSLYCQAVKQIDEDLPIISLYSHMRINGYSPQIEGSGASLEPRDFAPGLASWWIKPSVEPTPEPSVTPSPPPPSVTPDLTATPEPVEAPPAQASRLPIMLGAGLVVLLVVVALASVILRRRRASSRVQDDTWGADIDRLGSNEEQNQDTL
ncbi:MAG: peptide ABC transporter substrate-binding protein [Thermoflexales bacterium]|nr:peptide ABC transporter substrate-binding protein [Thermoflexales bacterium]